MEHLEWMRLGVACPDVLAEGDNLKTFCALGQDETVSHLFVEKMDPRDNQKQALRILLRLGQANMDDLHEYAALGVAYSLVFDQPFPSNWPHSQVPHAAVPIGDVDPVQRFAYYVRANRDKKLDNDLTQMTVENLKFMVDSKVNLSELDYAQQSRDRISYSSFGDAFFSINYDQARANAGNFIFMWPRSTYLLKDIETLGGICVDQAYHAVTLGKGRGIPTLYFVGQGADGGHAWFGYLSHSGKWELDAGKYENQNYPKGYTEDPQTWQTIVDTTLANFFKNGSKNPNYQPACNALAWARLQDDPAVIRKILDQARALMPELVQTWQMEAFFLGKMNASTDDRKTFYNDWLNQFQSFPDMKVEGQRRLLAVLKESNDPAADSLQQDIVLANRSAGFDVGIQAAADLVLDKVRSGDWDAARLEYEKTIRDFGDQGGGTLYYSVIDPYITACLKQNQVDQASRAIKFTEDRMPIDASSILGEEFGNLKNRVSTAKQAATQ